MFRSLFVGCILIVAGCSPASPSYPSTLRLQSLEEIQKTLTANAGKVIVLDLWTLW